MDPDGRAISPIYDQNGNFLGTVKQRAYKKNNDNGYDILKSGITKLEIGHDEFQEKAATVYGESSAYKTNGQPEELKNEMFAIASVHEKNNKAYGNDSESAGLFKDASPSERNYTKKQLAVAAELSAQLGGKDYSNGATPNRPRLQRGCLSPSIVSM
jgi:hypothetical protein